MTGLPLTIREAALALRAGTVTSVGLTKALIARADDLDPKLGVYITRMDESALAAAECADASFAVGLDHGPLQGIPLGLKDILSTSDAPTTAQSLTMDPAWSAQGDGPAVARLRAAGAVIMGKNTTMEFANGQPDSEKPFPIPRNPWNTEHWTGGSSSGTGAGIAAGLFYGGLGTDTGGSVRFPAALCGITGLKQTFGLVPKSGCTQNGFSLDHIGPMARSAWDAAAILEVISGYDATDATMVQRPVENYTAALTGDISGLRIGVLREYHTRGVEGVLPETCERFEAAAQALGELGASLTDVVIPHYPVFETANWVNNSAERSGIYVKRMQAQWQDWGRFTRVGGGTFGLFLSASDFMQTLRVRRYAQKVIARIMESYDVLISPTAKGGATRLDAMGYAKGLSFPINTGVWSFIGVPALAVPMGFTNDGLPLSLQVIGRPFEEATVLRVGDAYQSITDWHLKVPPIAVRIEVYA